MLRKRTKTIAQEMGVTVDDVLGSCRRLGLSDVRSESSLLSAEETKRVKRDLDEEQLRRRSALLRRETVVETSAGKVVEKRLNATVMRRRHAEPKTTSASALEPGKPSNVEAERALTETETFVAPILESPLAPEPQLPELLVEAVSAQKARPAQPIRATFGGVASSAKRDLGAQHKESRSETPTSALRRAGAAGAAKLPAYTSVHTAAPSRTIASTPPIAAGAKVTPAPAFQAAPSSQAKRPEPQSGAQPYLPGQAINLTSAAHVSAPTLDDGPRGPKVLGKIDLRKPAARPAAPSTIRPAAGPRPAERRRPAVSAVASQAPRGFVPLPAEPAKPGTRAIRKRQVVKPDKFESAAERQMRGRRVPRKRIALLGKEQRKTEITTPKASKRVVRVAEGVTVADLARNMGVKAAEIIKKLMGLGVMATLNQVLDVDTATLVTSDFGYTVENVAFDVESAVETGRNATAGEPLPRPPVVTVMGHVDHGKTSLLDAIRHTNVTDQEFGGITQHIGAYMVEVSGRKISFVDTPGHEAFTAMRARGAKVTDIVVLVVAADEGVMPQTVEAINHARAAGVPIVVAINKVDRPEANVDMVRQQLSEYGLIPEEWSGDTITVPLSARTGEGIERLLEMILLQADVMELKANRNRAARGTVVESQLDRGRGPIATVLIQEGTLRQGDPFVCGTCSGRVRGMLDHLGRRLTEAGPSTPVEVFGLSSVPEPGTAFNGVLEEAKARQIAEFRRLTHREGVLPKTSRVSLEDLSLQMKAGEVKELRVIIKGDVHGSAEALSGLLQRLSTDEVKLDLIHTSVGAISETDVTLAAASGAIIIGFNVRPEPKATQLAKKEGVEIRLYTIIYEAVNDIRKAMEGLLAPTYREKPLGRAEVRKTFMVQGTMVAGAMVLDGKIQRAARARLVRDGRVVWEGRIGSLKRFKDDARDVLAGYECGVGLENFNDVKPGDVIEDFEMEAVARKLAASKPEPVRTAGIAVGSYPRAAAAAHL
jgi:translation initiation factor IF-2